MSDTGPFATRLPGEEARRLQTALRETGRTQSEHVARAIRYYHRENPDNIPALHPEDQENPEDQSDNPDWGPLEELGILPPDVSNESFGVTDE